MFNQWLLPTTLLAAVGSGAMAGLLFAFSVFVMKSLSRLPPEQGLTAMQFINVDIFNPAFIVLFCGTPLLCLLLGIRAVLSWQKPDSPLLLLGSARYLIGTLGVTVAFNIPLNNSIAAIRSSSALAPAAWQSFVSSWMSWNHLRTGAAFAAALSLTIAATLMRTRPS